jgi:hypothetical protein
MAGSATSRQILERMVREMALVQHGQLLIPEAGVLVGEVSKS